ncbi:MAG: hypothetical protein WAZ34_04290 [Rhodocyclaceae bacterium]
MEEDVCFRLFRADGQFIAAYADPRKAAVVIATLGHGACIRDGLFRKDTLWREGAEKQNAAASLEFVVDTLMQRRTIRRTSQRSD